MSLFLRYRYTPSPLTLYAGINKLAPGTRLVVEDGRARVERWWDYDPKPFDPLPSLASARAELLDLYDEAVRRQLVSDVPLGLLLSGGIDSALLLSLMNRHGHQWPTFAVGFGARIPTTSSGMPRLRHRLFGAQHAEVLLDRSDFEKDLATIVDVLEEPIASPSVVALSHVCRRAREDVKVALIGQGPDELFGGYTRHLGVRYGHHWRRLPEPVRQGARSAFGLLRTPSVHRGLYALDAEPRLTRYQQIFSLMPGAEVDGLFRDGSCLRGRATPSSIVGATSTASWRGATS